MEFVAWYGGVWYAGGAVREVSNKGCVLDSWFSSRRRMGAAVVVCLVLAAVSVLLHNLLSALFGESHLLSAIPFTAAFIFIAGFAVAIAVWLILWLEGRFRAG